MTDETDYQWGPGEKEKAEIADILEDIRMRYNIAMMSEVKPFIEQLDRLRQIYPDPFITPYGSIFIPNKETDDE